MGLDYEEENALEWATPAERAKYEAEKAARNRPRPPQPTTHPQNANSAPWSVVAGRGRFETNLQGDETRNSPISQTKSPFGAPKSGPSYAGAALGQQRPGNSRIDAAAKTTSERVVVSGGGSPQPTSGRSLPPGAAARNAIPRPPQHQSVDRATYRPPRAGPRPYHGHKAGVEPQVPFPKVRPENDVFGKEAAKTRKEEQKKLTLIEKQALGDDEFGQMGIFFLSDQAASVPTTIVTSLKEALRNKSGHITYTQQSSTIDIVAPDTQTIQLALSRTRGMVSKSTGPKDEIAIILADSPATGIKFDSAVVQRVSTSEQSALPKAAGLKDPRTLHEMVPMTLPVSRSDTDLAADKRHIWRNTIAVQVATTRALSRLSRHQGQITMRFSFGALVFHRYQWEQGTSTQSLRTFMDNLKNPGTTASMYKLAPAAKFFDRLCTAGDLLASYYGRDASEVRPSFSGLFIWTNGNQSDRIYKVETEDLPLDKTCAPAVTKRGWMPPNAPGSDRQLSVFLTELNGGISCALQIHTETNFQQAKDTPPGLTAQVTRLLSSEDYERAASRNELMFDWRKTDCNDYRQRVTWKYRVKSEQAYILEVTRYDNYSHKKDKLDRKPSETRWDAILYHEDWDQMFSENIRLKPGEEAGWHPSMEKFFPTEDADAVGEPGIPAGVGTLMDFLRDFLHRLNAKERERIWRDDPVPEHSNQRS